ncbi:MAG: hypothetical protein WA956_15195 [Stenotrophomonas sp.]
MKEELVQRLFTTWPQIFAPIRNGLAYPEPERRITCGDGWFPVIDTLCEALQWETDHASAPQIVVAQIKSKLGSMRFAAPGPRSERQGGMIHMALMLSACIDEDRPWPGMPETGESRPPQHRADSIIRMAREGAGALAVGGNLGTDAIVRIIKNTAIPVTVKVGDRSGDALVRIAKAGGSRVTLDFS